MLNAHTTIFFPSFGFVIKFWVCFEHSTHTPRCSTPIQQFFVSESWVCSRVLGLFRTFHAHTMMLNAHPTIFCFRVLGLFASFGFVSNILRTHHDPQRPPYDFLFPSFGFVYEFHYNSTTNPELGKKIVGWALSIMVCVWNVRNKPKTRKQKIVGWALSIVEYASNVRNKSKTRQQTQDPEQSVQTSIVSNGNYVSF